MAEFAHDNEAFGGLAIEEAGNDFAVVRRADFVVEVVGRFVPNAIETVAEDVRFNLSLALHGDHGSGKVGQAYEYPVSRRLTPCFRAVIGCGSVTFRQGMWGGSRSGCDAVSG
jgi:hypothetical protein